MRVVICGGGSTAEFLAREMLEARHRVTIIEEKLEDVERLSTVLPSKVTIVLGDGCDPEIQRDAGVGESDMFISLAGRDETNLVACQLALTSFEVPRAIATVSSPKNQRIFHELGIESVSSTELISRMVEQEAVMGDVRMVFSLHEGDITMVETHLPKRMRHRGGIRVDELPPMRQAQLIAVVRDGDFVMINHDVILLPGEALIAAVKSEYEEEFRDIIHHL